MPEAGPIQVERARVTKHERWPGAQHVVRFAAPEIAARAAPGSFVHMDCGPQWLLRRPMSLMSAAQGEIEVLFKEVGHGTLTLARLEAGEETELIGPIGNGFAPVAGRPRRVLIGGGVGIPPMIYFAETLVAAGELPPSGSPGPRPRSEEWDNTSPPPCSRSEEGGVGERFFPLVLAGSELPLPFELQAATLAAGSAEASPASGEPRAISRLEKIGVPNRLASLADIPGSFRGFVTELAEQIIAGLAAAERNEIALYACGPTPMLAAVAALARRYALPCQVSLEEYMACAVGGCAGCTVEVATESGPAMQRVCVDGPVFDAAAVFPAQPLDEPGEPPFE